MWWDLEDWELEDSLMRFTFLMEPFGRTEVFFHTERNLSEKPFLKIDSPELR